MSQLPCWVQYVRALGPTAVAFAVGAIAALIAYWQSKTAHYRLRLDMFEKRFAVYQAVTNVVHMRGNINQEGFAEFYKIIRGAEFLFDGETRDLLTRVDGIAWRGSRGQLTHDDVRFLAQPQLQGRLEDRFRRYLDLSKVGLK